MQVSYEQSAIEYVWKNDEDTLRKSPSLTTLNAYLITNRTISCPTKTTWRAVNSYPSTSYPRDPVVIESSLMTPSQPFDMIRTPIHSSHSVMNRIPNNLETPMFRSSPTILNLSALNHSHGYYRLTQRINLSTFSDTSSVFGSPIPAIQPGTNRVNNNERNFPEQGQIMET
ncbi:hypothetical protein M8J76_014277 [Diaphorina citri]|nr:hypothetical protein M8J76_014277 [Diaphorina citri]